MKYSATLTRPDGKTVTLAANDWLDIDIKDGSRYIARLTVRDGEVYDEDDNEIKRPWCNECMSRKCGQK
jgi:hypothetical protein